MVITISIVGIIAAFGVIKGFDKIPSKTFLYVDTFITPNAFLSNTDERKIKKMVTLHRANRAFYGLRRCSTYYKHRQNVSLHAREIFKKLAFKDEYSRYNVLAQSKPERVSLSAALLAAYIS